MGRYASPQRTEIQNTLEGDNGFHSVDMKRDRSQLENGVLALSINKRLRKGIAETRLGTWPPVFANILEPTEIRGWGVYTNPNGNETLLYADSTEVHVLEDGNYPNTIEADGTLGAEVEFVQAHDKIFIFQGTELPQLVWDGVDPRGFTRIVKSDETDTSTTLIPPAVTAEHIADRLVIIKDENNILLSDIGDYTSYDAALEVFYVDNDSGATDAVKRVFNYAKGIAIIFSSRSTSLLLNFTGDPDDHSVELLSPTIGLAGRKAVVMVGGDVMFLSEPGGIYRVTQIFENRQQVVPLPVSDPIQPLIERINWLAADGAVAAINGEYVYFAVPIDNSTYNNAVIVYNASSGVIEGYDTWLAGFHIDDFKNVLYNGERRLFALDKNRARIYMMYEGNSDFLYYPTNSIGPDELPDPDAVGTQIAVFEFDIRDMIETRGFATLGWNSATRRDFKKVEAGVSTWAPEITVTALTDSVSDERPLNSNPITMSRTEYNTFARPDWDETNILEDWATPGRQDYSVTINDAGYVTGEVGIDSDRKQSSTLRFSTKARGRWVSYRISNTQGQCDVRGVLIESTGTQRELRRGG